MVHEEMEACFQHQPVISFQENRDVGMWKLELCTCASEESLACISEIPLNYPLGKTSKCGEILMFVCPKKRQTLLDFVKLSGVRHCLASFWRPRNIKISQARRHPILSYKFLHLILKCCLMVMVQLL